VPDHLPAPTPTRASDIDWCDRRGDEVAELLGVDPLVGLDDVEVDDRRARTGPNRLAEPPARTQWAVFLDQFRSGIVYVLAGAGLLAGLLGDIKDLVVIFVVLLINAVLGFVQETKASNALAALERMLVTRVRVRRNGATGEITIDAVVPGDIVLLEAGDRVPADGRLLLAANLAIDESSLTGESVPVDKVASSTVAGDAPIGDRLGMVYMNTTVVRGRAEVIITATGMATEMGRVAELLSTAEPSRTPLERQLDGLSRKLAVIAGLAAAIVFIVQWAVEKDFGTAVLGAVALAVAAIPEGLPAVVTVTLAIGVSYMAKEHAIVKHLHSVETLGSTSVICSDKTGTLTLNQMTAREAVRGGAVWLVGGEGYATTGSITGASGSKIDPTATTDALSPAVLCSDAVVLADGSIIGDPTEAALVVLAAKAGVDAPTVRARQPRLGEVPFDSATKYMATFHRCDPEDPTSDVLVCVKGAPDVVMRRVTEFVEPHGGVGAFDARARAASDADVDVLGTQGMRVLAIATRTIPATDALDLDGSVSDPEHWITDLRLELLVGIVDPPRVEARDAINLCRRAGIQVKMITGDHAVTAGAIADQLGIEGDVVTGEELAEMSDDALDARIESIGVCARVSPKHKVRVVESLRRRGAIVAMTGDGVNDAAALRRSDIGVAMGITGTEVTREAGDMVLTDDNFATIVKAVERGRVIFDNILKFVRFQLATSFGAITTILGASLFGAPVPFTPLQVLWVNLIADGPPAIALGVDAPDPGTMSRPPVPADAPILDRRRLSQVIFQGVATAAGVLTLYLWAISHYEPHLPDGAQPKISMTMAFTSFVLAQLVNVFNARSETRSVFTRYTFTNWRLWSVVGVVLVLQVAATEVEAVRDIFDTARLTAGQWGLCLLVPVALILAVELWKAVDRTSFAPRGGSTALAAEVGTDD
jgi:Ca2+-transporting ATPase